MKCSFRLSPSFYLPDCPASACNGKIPQGWEIVSVYVAQRAGSPRAAEPSGRMEVIDGKKIVLVDRERESVLLPLRRCDLSHDMSAS